MLTYDNLESITIRKPVARVRYISSLTEGRVVLDIGCYDETALSKKNTQHYLHQEIVFNAKEVVGIDSSSLLPADGFRDADNSYIYKTDVFNIPDFLISNTPFDTIVAGEFIEHIENHVYFLKYIRENFKSATLVISTPNGMAISNFLMGLIRKEVQHPDHIHIFSYKTLYTIFLRAGYSDFEIIPYHFYATEMIINSKGLKRFLVIGIEKAIKFLEWFFPLNCMGYIVVANKKDV